MVGSHLPVRNVTTIKMSSNPQQNEETPAAQDDCLLPSPPTSSAELGSKVKQNAVRSPISSRSSPPEPLPELNEDLDSELAELSPAFAHEVNSNTALGILTLPGPAENQGSHEDSRTMALTGGSCAHDDDQESEGMREATQRQLQWVRMMFGKNTSGGDAKEELCEEEIREGEAT